MCRRGSGGVVVAVFCIGVLLCGSVRRRCMPSISMFMTSALTTSAVTILPGAGARS